MQADDLDHVEEEGGDDEEESEEEEEEELVEMLSKNLPKRRSRGTRMRSLMDQEQEADNAFWGQKAWDEGSDDDYEHVSEKDSEDPDIDQAEVDDGEYGDASLGKQRRTKAKAGAYQDPAAARRGRKAGAPRGARAAGGRAPRIPVERVARSFRKTTQNRSSVAKTAREADAAERVKQRKARPARKVVVEFQMTQEDLLREAAQTEVENRRSLGTMLQVEEENSKSGAPGSKVRGPRIRFKSKRGCMDSVTFTDVDQFPEYIDSSGMDASARMYPEKPVCAVTGLPAKYRDPVTGLPYATLAAFKAIRREYEEGGGGDEGDQGEGGDEESDGGEGGGGGAREGGTISRKRGRSP
jgi:vacuolar protein sorting-associated protein 72